MTRANCAGHHCSVTGHWSLVTGHWPLFTVRSLLKALLHNQYGSYESCQAIHGSYLFQRIGNIWMVMLVCIKRTITAKSKVPLLRFIVIQKGHCISLAGCGMREKIKARYRITRPLKARCGIKYFGRKGISSF